MVRVTGNALTPTANKVLEIARSQVGYHEGRDANGNWNNDQKYSKQTPGLAWSNFMAWCCTFIAWCAWKAGISYLVPQTASTDTAASWYQKRQQWSTEPAIGAQGFLANGTNEFHTFWVWAYDDTYIWTYEGNSNNTGSPQGDGVYSLVRRRRDAVIEGYGYPAYPEGIISADPAWADRAPKAPVPPKPKRKKKPVKQTISFTVAENNLKSLPVNSDVLGTLLATPLASVLLVCEADLNQFKSVIGNLRGYKTHDLHLGDNTYDAFVLYKPTIWSHVSTRFVKLYDGVGNISYTRHIAVTVLQHLATGQEFSFISFHSVTAGNDRERRRLRRIGRKNLNRVVATERKTGRPVIKAGDDNTPKNNDPSATVHTSHGIDHQWAWNGQGVTIQRTGAHTVGTTSDHRALVVRYGATVG